MQKGREVQDNNVFESRRFGDFGFHRSMMMPSLFGGRDPFDDPFFTDPFDSLLGSSSASRGAMHKTNKEKGIVIEELGSDDEAPETGEEKGNFNKKHYKSTVEPSVEHPDDEVNNERKNSDVIFKNDLYKSEPPKGRNVSFQTSRVTYGGIDGAYYTSTRTRRRGVDGVMVEESKEADSTTGQAAHRITRGIHDKGHSVFRKLDSDGKVDTTQTLHNLNEDELAGFEEAWKGNNIGHLPGFDAHRSHDYNDDTQNRNQVWSLPSLEQARRARGFASDYETGTNSEGRTKKVVRINIE